MKNNSAECVLMSLEEYVRLMDEVNVLSLLYALLVNISINLLIYLSLHILLHISHTF